METEDNDATMRESFTLVQNILFIIDNTDILPAHLQENIVEKHWGNLVWLFDDGLWREILMSLYEVLEIIPPKRGLKQE